MYVQQKVVIVTGGIRGIGFVTVQHLLRNEAAVGVLKSNYDIELMLLFRCKRSSAFYYIVRGHFRFA